MQHYPKEWHCPITQELMKDPVIGPDGQTYEKAAIIDWLARHKTSPLTRLPMGAEQLVPNYALRSTIQEILQGSKPVLPTEPTGPEETKGAPTLGLEVSTVQLSETSGVMHLSLTAPNEGKRQPFVFICMLDVSGSMNESASVDTGVETDGFTRLDLVKHSVKTTIHMLAATDYLAIISFNSEATLVLEITQMSDRGKELAIERLDSLVPSGNTNIWDALRVAINLTKAERICGQLNTSLLLFTDGEPNVNPPRGILPALTNYIQDVTSQFTIHTFGYGYSLDSYLLYNISVIGSGNFCYIPDCTMVGTVFVNYLSNCLSTAVKNAMIELQPTNVDACACMGYPMKNNQIIVGAVQYGQPRDFVIKFGLQSGRAFAFTLKLRYEGHEQSQTVDQFSCAKPLKLHTELARCLYIERMLEGTTLQKRGKPTVATFLQDILTELARSQAKDEALVLAFVRDITSENENEGQVTKAFSRADWYEKWGKHYVRSLIRAHQLEQCHNFKDPSVQLYGGKLFKDFQTKTENLFCSLPPPKPSVYVAVEPKPAPFAAPASAAYVPAKVPKHTKRQNMRAYMDFHSGCFDGESCVALADGSFKRVRELRKDDVLRAAEGRVAKVVCLVRMAMHREVDVVDLSGMKITPWHPVRVEGQWRFPIDLRPLEKFYCEYIYNLVLDTGHVVLINGVEVVTLGHGKTDNAVVEHPYFGTQKVIDELARLQGWADGNVLLSRYTPTRDPATHLVQSLL